MGRQRIAVIGAGAAGLGAAWLLSRRHAITVFEASRHGGGHAHTLEVDTPEGPVAVDTGFVVYNERNYPLLTRLFGWLDVATQPTDMSFAASVDGGALEYAGTDLSTLFGQRRRLADRRFWGMLGDIARFNARAQRDLGRGLDPRLTLGEYLDRGGYGEPFRRHYLLPMGAAIWSAPLGAMLAFPARSFLGFVANHGLLDLWGRPRWRTVTGGSQRYVEMLLADLGERVHTGRPVRAVRRTGRGVAVHTDGGAQDFDAAVLACHADQALALLDAPTPLERSLLGAFRYQPNRALLHGDPALMPRLRRVWSSWNALVRSRAGDAEAVSVTYWMNRLQRLNVSRDLFVSLNPVAEPRPETVITELHYTHPLFDADALAARARLDRIQGRDRLWFCGSYLGHGFHEDALRSAVQVAAALGVRPPWEPMRAPAGGTLALEPAGT